MIRYVFAWVLASYALLPAITAAQQPLSAAAPSGIAHGTIRDVETARPLGGVSLSVSGTGSGAMTDAEGRYRLVGVPEGARTLSFRLPGYETVQREVQIVSGQELAVDIEMQSVPYKLTEIIVTDRRTQVASKTETAVMDIPQVVQVVPQALIVEQQAREFEDVLRNVSGATFNGTSGGNFQYFHLRGFYLLPTSNFRRNGVEINAMGPLLQANVDHVEVLKGPSSVLYGNLNPGGVVNVVTKQPQARFAGEAELRGSSFGFLNPRLDVTGPLNHNQTLLGRLNLSYEEADSFRDDVKSDGLLIAPVLSWRPTHSTTVTLEGEYSQQKRVNDAGIVSPGTAVSGLDSVPAGTFLGEPDGRFEWQVASMMLTAEHQFSEGWRIRGIASRSDFHRAPMTIDITGLAADNRTVNRAFNARTQDYLYTSGELNLMGEVRTGPLAHSLLVGTDYYQIYTDQVLFRGPIGPVDYLNPVRTGVPSGEQLTLGTDTSQRDNRLGLYFQDQVSIHARVDLLAGVRYTQLDRRTTNRLGVNGPVTTDKRDEEWSPRLGLLVRMHRNVSLFGNVSESFVPVYELDRQGNPFDPMRGKQYELGFKMEALDGKLVGNATVYQLTQSNVVSFLVDDLGFYAVQGGRHRSRGLELDLIGSPAQGWNISAAYAYTEAVVVDDPGYAQGRALAGAPKHNFNLWSTYEFPNGIGFGGGAYHVGAMRGFLSSRALAPSYTRLDATVFARLGTRYMLRASVRNLLDTRYYSRAFASETATYTNAEVGAPRNMQISISARF